MNDSVCWETSAGKSVRVLSIHPAVRMLSAGVTRLHHAIQPLYVCVICDMTAGREAKITAVLSLSFL